MTNLTKYFLCYWGQGYASAELTSEVNSLKLMTDEGWDDDLIEWCESANVGESTWEFGGPLDEFFVVRVR